MQSKEKAKVLACLKSIEELGCECPRVEFRQIDGYLWEIKIKTASAGFRIFYVRLASNVLVLLHGFRKQSQKTPKKEIDVAQQRMKEALNNEDYYTRSSH